MPAMIDWAASTVLTFPDADAEQRGEGVGVEGRVERVDAERGEPLDLLGVADDPQGQALLGPHLGDVEPRSALEPHAQGEGAAARPGPVGGQLVLPLDPAAPGQVDDQPAARRGPCTGTSPAG